MDEDKFIRTLTSIARELDHHAPSWCIYGSCAWWIGGQQAELPHDIDILLPKAEALRLHKEWKQLEKPLKEEGKKFRSLHTLYEYEGIEIDVSVDLEMKGEDGQWRPVNVHKVEMKHGWRYASLEDCIRIMRLFGRRKDLERLKKLEAHP